MATPMPDLFTRHSDSVLCCAIDDRTKLAVSGGIDDTAFVWDLGTKHVIFECAGHKESVTAAAFNLNSTYVATGDLNGYIQVRNTTTGIKVFDTEIDEINWILWHNKSEYVLLAGTTKGDFWMWNVHDQSAVKIFPSYGSACSVAKLVDDGMNIVVGYQDGSIRVFDLKTSKAVHKAGEAGSAEIISMDLGRGNSLLAVGGIDSSIRLFTLSDLKLIGTLHCKTPKKLAEVKPGTSSDDVDESMDHEAAQQEQLEIVDEYANPPIEGDTLELGDDDNEDDESDTSDDDPALADGDSVESVLFTPCGNYLAAANNSGTIGLWEVSSQATRCERHTDIGITRSVWIEDGQYVTACLDGIVRVYDFNLNEVKQIAAHKDQILDMAYREGVLVTASEDKTCRVVKL